MREILNDFLSAVLLSKPDDVYLFAKEYFHPFNPTPVKEKPLIICGPYGVGKKTIRKYMLEKYGDLFDYAWSYTTRLMKADEEQGVQYNFISDAEFDWWAANGEFLEQVEHWNARYGTSQAEIDRIWKENKIPLIEVDFKGAKNLSTIAANFVFVYPPSIQTLWKRLAAWTDITEELFKQRIAEAIKEIELANNAVLFTNRIVNDDFHKTEIKIQTLVDALYF